MPYKVMSAASPCAWKFARFRIGIKAKTLSSEYVRQRAVWRQIPDRDNDIKCFVIHNGSEDPSLTLGMKTAGRLGMFLSSGKKGRG